MGDPQKNLVIQIYRIRRPSSSFALCCNGEAWQRILSSKINRVRVVRRADGYCAQLCLDVERKEQG